MKVDIYDSRNNCIDTIENVESVNACKDGRYLITKIDKCESCNQDNRFVVQVPVGYEITIKMEIEDKILVEH